MTATTITDFREKLKEYLDRVLDNHEALIISRPKKNNVVVISQEEYESLRETAYLLSSPKNAARLHEALQQLEQTNWLFYSAVITINENHGLNWEDFGEAENVVSHQPRFVILNEVKELHKPDSHEIF